MEYNYATDKRDMARIDKLNNLRYLRTYWDDVRKLTKNVVSDSAIKRWQRLAEVRFEEVKKIAIKDYYESYRLLSMEVGSDTMSFVDRWIHGQGSLPSYDMSGDDRSLAISIKQQYNTLKEYGLIK